MLFLIIVLIPGIRLHPDKVNLIESISQKFRVAGNIALIILLTTGLLQLHHRGMQWNWDYISGSPFGKIAAVKLLVFISIGLLGLIHDKFLGQKTIELWKRHPQDPLTIRARKRARILGRINFILSLVAIILGVLLVRGW